MYDRVEVGRRASKKYRESIKGKLATKRHVKARIGRSYILDSRLKHSYGITLAQYEEFLSKQKGVCAICKNKCSTNRRLAVDHDHRTGKVRGLLCARCNKGLGEFQDNPQLIKKAINYLKKHAI